MEKGKAVKATWDPVAHSIFLDVCIEEVQAKNRQPGQSCLNAIGYANLVRKFNARTSRNYERKQFKNRWEALKKDYNCWKSLNQHASGLGRDPITNSIAASDDWWDNEIKRCVEASKFRYAPLADEDKMREIFEQHSVTNEYARVPVPSSQVGTSHINVLNDDDSGCEEVTPTQVPGKGGKKRACPYSPSPTLVEKVAKVDEEKGAFTRMVDLFAKREEKRNSMPSEPIVIVDPVKVEFKEMMTMVVKAGGLPGSDEHFYASQMFMKKEYRDAFGCSCFEDAEPSTILGWINRTWEMFTKNK